MDSLATYSSAAAPLAPSPAGTMRYGLLKATHAPNPPEDRGYDIRVWRELDDLYRGGYQILEHAAKYLPKTINENEERWRERCILAAYIGYFGRIVQAYVGAIFSNGVSVVPAGDAENPETPGELPDREAYDAFSRDADLKGCSFEALLRDVTTWALVKQKALICVDFPAMGATPKSRAESDALGTARPYAYRLDAECLTDWEIESEVSKVADLGNDRKIHWTVGRFKWCIVKKVIKARPDPSQLRSAPVEEYRIWKKDPDSGLVIWEIYRTRPIVEGSPMSDDEPVPMVDSGVTTFREIPIVELKLPEALWLGNIIGPLNLEHWRRRSALLAAQQRSLLPFPVAYLGPEIPAFQGQIMADVQQDPSRAAELKKQWEQRGFGVMGSDDKVTFEGPDAAPFGIVDGQLDKLVDEIYRVAGQMSAGISSSSKALGRSGLSKSYDYADFITAVSAIAAIVSDCAKRTYTVISEARGEDVVWNVHGLSGYEELEDRAIVLEEALQIEAVQIPSATFKRHYRLDLASKLLPGMDPKTKATIRDEIISGTPDEETMLEPKVEPVNEVPAEEQPEEAQPKPTDIYAKPEAPPKAA